MYNKIKLTFKQRLNTWWNFKVKMFQLWWFSAPKYQKNLEKGIYYLRKGAIFQVGQPFKIKDKHTGKFRTRYIDNLFFNFKQNTITHKFSDRPIKGYTEKFETRR
jgi:hypothetical protein